MRLTKAQIKIKPTSNKGPVSPMSFSKFAPDTAMTEPMFDQLKKAVNWAAKNTSTMYMLSELMAALVLMVFVILPYTIPGMAKNTKINTTIPCKKGDPATRPVVGCLKIPSAGTIVHASSKQKINMDTPDQSSPFFSKAVSLSTLVSSTLGSSASSGLYLPKDGSTIFSVTK